HPIRQLQPGLAPIEELQGWADEVHRDGRGWRLAVSWQGMGASEHIGDAGPMDVVRVEVRLGEWILKRGGKVDARPELAAVHRLRHRHLHDERDPLVHIRFRVIPEALYPVP